MTHHPETERDPAADLAPTVELTPNTDEEAIDVMRELFGLVVDATPDQVLHHICQALADRDFAEREAQAWRERAERAEGEREEMREARRLAVLAQYKERDRAEKAEAALTAARTEAARLRGVVEAAKRWGQAKAEWQRIRDQWGAMGEDSDLAILEGLGYDLEEIESALSAAVHASD